MKQTSEAAFKTAIEAVLLADGYHRLRPRPDHFPGTELGFIRETQPKAWNKLDARHREKTSEWIQACTPELFLSAFGAEQPQHFAGSQ